tara:strand:- start:433 stop:1464 length:1032 start_codon:yes stop_codon:yes gene_type:complete
MAEESNLAEEIISSTEETKEESFDASAFLGAEVETETTLEDEEPSESIESSKTEDTTKSEGESSEDDSFSWDEVVTDTKVEETTEDTKEVVEAKEEELDWDDSQEEPESKETTTDFNWEELGQEAGIEASSKEEFLEKVKEAFKPPVDDNDTINNLNTYLELSDKDLVIADMRAAKYDDADIEDTIDRLEDAGLLKREATLVRSQLTKHIHSEKDRLRSERVNAEKLKTENAGKSKKELQSYIKDKEEFFGGKVSQKDKKQLYSYITKGDFAQDIFESHANVAEAAFLWRNREKIFKMVRSQGVEQGKSKILDGITSPNRGNRSSNSYEIEGKGFNPNKFLSD